MFRQQSSDEHSQDGWSSLYPNGEQLVVCNCKSLTGPLKVSFGIGTTGSSGASDRSHEDDDDQHAFERELEEMQADAYGGMAKDEENETSRRTIQMTNSQIHSQTQPSSSDAHTRIRSPIKAHQHTAHQLGPSTSSLQGSTHYPMPDLVSDMVALAPPVVDDPIRPTGIPVRLGPKGDSFILSGEIVTELPRLPPEEEVIYTKPPKVLHGYLFGSVLGEGSYGKVKECLDSRTLVRYAVKILKLNKLRRIPGGLQNVEQEINILRRLKHPNVVNLREVFRIADKRKWYLVLDYCVGSMQEMLDHAPNKRLPVFQAHEYFAQLIDGIDHLHSAGVVHKDIKPGNLLLALDETLKITDFGVAEVLDRYRCDDTCSCGQGTPKFQPPEIASGQSDQFLGFPVDIWAAGVTLYNFVSGSYPFDGSAILPLYQNIAQNELEMPEGLLIDQHLEDLLRSLMIKDPMKRITVDQIRQHSWYKRKHPIVWPDRVPIPNRHDCGQVRQMTVFPYLQMLYGEDCCSQDEEDAGSGTGETLREKHSDTTLQVSHSMHVPSARSLQESASASYHKGQDSLSSSHRTSVSRSDQQLNADATGSRSSTRRSSNSRRDKCNFM